MFLGFDAVPFHGLEPDRQPNGVCVSDLQSPANPLGPAGTRGVEPPNLADDPPVAARWRSSGRLFAAILRILQLAGAHGVDVELARQGATPGFGQDAAATTRGAVPQSRPPRRTLRCQHPPPVTYRRAASAAR